MEKNILANIFTLFRNVTLNSLGAQRSLGELLADNDVETAIMRMDEHDLEVDNAVQEYFPQTHKVMFRENKFVKGNDPYITEKLPRTRQRYINEVELFFLLGNPILWKKDEGDDDAYKMFKDYLKEIFFDSKIRQVKRCAGAETEAAFVYHFHRDMAGNLQVDPYVASRTKGYKLRELFDQYGVMQAGAVGYNLNVGGRTRNCWDIMTPTTNYQCIRGTVGWTVYPSPNPTGKINMIYFRQPKSWEGAERRINREEQLDSRNADTNNYFADPMAAATADVIEAMPQRDKPGKLIQLTGSNSKFEYINPPTNSEMRAAEKKDLENSILFDTFTPDMSSQTMQSMATLTSVGIKRALVLGYIKRANRMEIYGEMIERWKNLTIAVLKALHPEMASQFDTLKISFEFAEPFNDDKTDMWGKIGTAYQQGIISLETAVTLMALTDAPEEEIAKIKQAAQERAAMQMQAKQQPQPKE
jgi:hypothetical protein